MWCVPPRRRHQLSTGSLVIDTLSVDSVTSVPDLGVGYTWTLTCRWTRTCLGLSVLASVSYDKYAVSVDRCRVRRWQH